MGQGEEGRKACEESCRNKCCGGHAASVDNGDWDVAAGTDSYTGMVIVSLPHIARGPTNDASDTASVQPKRPSIGVRITLKNGHVDRLKGKGFEFVNSGDFVIITAGEDGGKERKCIAVYAKSEVLSVVRAAL